MMTRMFTYILSTLALLYLIGWAAHLHHFHAKFKRCNALESLATNYAERMVYRQATWAAHIDTASAPLWPTVVHRWNVDYVAEARQLESQR